MSSYTRRRGDATCQICGERFTVSGGGGLHIFRHGHMPFADRPAPCFGSDWPPFEEARGRLGDWIDVLTAQRMALLARIMELEAEPRDVHDGGVVYRAAEAGYPFARRRALARLRRELGELDNELARSRARFEAWAGQQRRVG